MKFSVAIAVFALSLSLSANHAVAQLARGHIVVPASSIAKPGDAGKRAHTNVRMFVPDFGFKNVNPFAGPPFLGYGFETPASIGCLYHLTAAAAGCNPNTVTANPGGGSKAIAIVDAYDDPDAVTDLTNFCKQFGVAFTKTQFKVVFATGTRPAKDPTGGWEFEESLDIEWAHAMAPNAKLYLVEANSDSLADLYAAVNVASGLVSTAGGGEVSMSWGSGEYTGETSDDSNFMTSGIVYLASTGDAEGVEYPSVSPYVVAAGGTTISRNPTTLAFQEETGWNLAGGGPSQLEPIPSYQSTIASTVGSARGTPDLSFDSDPDSGVWVLDSIPYNGEGGAGTWWIAGGTSLAVQGLAGIVNSAGHFKASSEAELTMIYNNLGTTHFRDIMKGTCYFYNGYLAAKGWDFCSGVGSVNGKGGE
jgi:kumamolisin